RREYESDWSRRRTAVVAHSGYARRRRIVGRIRRIRALGRTRRTTLHDVVDLVGVYGFPFEQGRGHGFHLVAVIFDNATRHGILFVDDLADFLVYLLHGGLGHMRGFGNAAPQEYLAFVFGVDHRPQGIGHAIARDDV